MIIQPSWVQLFIFNNCKFFRYYLIIQRLQSSKYIYSPSKIKLKCKIRIVEKYQISNYSNDNQT